MLPENSTLNKPLKSILHKGITAFKANGEHSISDDLRYIGEDILVQTNGLDLFLGW